MHATSLFRYILPFTAAFMAVQATQEQLVFRVGGEAARGNEESFQAASNAGGAASKEEPLRVASNDKPSLGDLLTVDGRLSIFYGYLRESTSLSQRLVNPAMSTTIFAPRDATIQSLTRKPHQGEPTSGNEGTFTTEDEKARAAYLEKWVGMHIVAGGDLKLHDGVEVETLAGDEGRISFVVKKDGKEDGEEWQRVQVMPGHVNIIEKKEARDGQIYIIDGTLL